MSEKLITAEAMQECFNLLINFNYESFCPNENTTIIRNNEDKQDVMENIKYYFSSIQKHEKI